VAAHLRRETRGFNLARVLNRWPDVSRASTSRPQLARRNAPLSAHPRRRIAREEASARILSRSPLSSFLLASLRDSALARIAVSAKRWIPAMTYRRANRRTYCDVTYRADRHAQVYHTHEISASRACHLTDKIIRPAGGNDSGA